MKRFLIFLVALTTIFSAIGVSADTSTVRMLTLEEAQKIALENSIKYQLQDSYINDALQNYYDIQDANDKASGRPSSGMMNYFNKTITPEISLESAANSVRLSRFEKEDIKRASDYNVKIAFLNIKKAHLKLINNENDTKTKLKDLETAKLKYNFELITKNELNQFEKAYNDSIANQKVANEDLKTKYQTLNRYLGRAIDDYNIQIIYEINKISLDDIDLDKIREANIKNNKSFYTLEQNLKLAQRKYDLTKERYEHFEKLGVQNSRQDMLDAYNDAERDYENARKSFEDATKDLDISLNSNYNALKNAVDAAARLERDINDFKDELAKLKLKYDLGSIPKNDYENQLISLDTMQNNLTSLLADVDMQYTSLMLYADDTTTN